LVGLGLGLRDLGDLEVLTRLGLAGERLRERDLSELDRFLFFNGSGLPSGDSEYLEILLIFSFSFSMLGDLEDLDFECLFDLLFSTGLLDLEFLGDLSVRNFIGLGLREPDILSLLVDLFLEGDMLWERDLRLLILPIELSL